MDIGITDAPTNSGDMLTVSLFGRTSVYLDFKLLDGRSLLDVVARREARLEWAD